MSVYADLSRTCARLANSRPSWMVDPSLRPFVDDVRDGLNEVEAVIQAVRSYRTSPEASDHAILALVGLAKDTPDALTVLLEALVPSLLVKMSRSVTEDYRTDALADLVFVVCDAIERDDLSGRSQLALRLVNRAHNRGYRRARRHHAHPWDPEWLDCVDEAASSAVADVADLAVARADLAVFSRAVDDAVRRGRLSSTGWDTFRDHRLGRLVREAPCSTSAERALSARFARSLQPFVDAYLAGHAA